jgi:hypothetical protein
LEHQAEYKVTQYNIPTFKAIDSAEEELIMSFQTLLRSMVART